MSQESKFLELGVCDYPEHVTEEHWQKQPARMKALGLSYVRLAEFAWSKLEPQRDQFNFAWLDEAILLAQDAGLKVVLCTPTATPPAWLVQEKPDILATDAEGRLREFGSRRHYDFSSRTYWQESKRIVEIIAKRYGTHQAVAGWQTDNEYGCHDTARSYSQNALHGFRKWLEEKYKTLDALNNAWGNVFWSQNYSAFHQIALPNLTVTEPNPSHVLDFYRYCSEQVVLYDQMQCEIIRAYSPGRFITHNFMIFESGFDHYKAAAHLDFVSWDNYPLGTLENFSFMDDATKQEFARTGHPDLTACIHDIYRGLKRKSFWVMEQQCGQTNWATYNPLPAVGATKLWTLQAFAHGADCVSYFRWQAANMSQEVLHSGLQHHDGTPDRGYAEVAELAPHLQKLPSQENKQNKIALLHDYESLWAIEQQRHGANASYWAQLMLFYSVLREHGQDVDIVHPDVDLSGYSLIVAPAITIVGQARAEHFEKTARAGAHMVFGPRTGFRDVTGQAWSSRAPGPLADAAGVRLKNFDSLRPGLTSRMELLDQNFVSHTWNESFEVMQDDVTVLGRYQDDPMYNQAAITNRNLGAGSISMVGAWGEKLLANFLEYISSRAGLHLENLPKGMRISRRAGAVYVQNWSRGGMIAPASESAEFLYGSPLLEAGGVAVFKE